MSQLIRKLFFIRFRHVYLTTILFHPFITDHMIHPKRVPSMDALVKERTLLILEGRYTDLIWM